MWSSILSLIISKLIQKTKAVNNKHLKRRNSYNLAYFLTWIRVNRLPNNRLCFNKLTRLEPGIHLNHRSKKYAVNQDCMSLSTYYLEYGRHLARLRRRRPRAYALTSNTANNDHQKINSYVSFYFLYEYGAPLGGPSGRRSSAITKCDSPSL